MTLLDDPDERRRRLLLLGGPHMRPLARYVAALRADTGAHVPDLDPLDGGVEATVLLLLETPGPSIRATGFVSRDNPTPTARNIRRFSDEAGLGRERTAIWNAVPWTIHEAAAANRAPRPGEIRDGIGELPRFLALMPRLRTAILAGRVAREARPVLERIRPDLVVLLVPHPSPVIVCTDKAIGDRIRAGFRAAAADTATERAAA